MKELTIEQKAKRYDETMEKAHQLCAYPTTKPFISDLQDLFSELKENEDEKIKHEIKVVLANTDLSQFALDYTFADMITWLEKQGEQDNNEDLNILQRFSFYSYKDEPNILYLSGLYVNEEYRNKGIGTKILEVADEVAKSLNCHAIRLKTKKGSSAERLYRTYGYNSLVTEERDEIWLEKQGKQKPVKNIVQIWKDMRFEIHMQASGDDMTRMFSLNDIDEIIEKISEQKLADKVEPKFHQGEWIICCDYEPVQIISIRTNAYETSNGDIRPFWMIDNNNNIRPWTIQDAKPGDVLVDEDNNIGICKEIDGIYWDSYIYLGCDGELRGFSIGGKHKQTDTHPATKEQRDALMKAMADAGYTFDFEKKELKKVKQKPIEWHREESLYDYMANVAKHFFELGLKAQKGE